MQFHHVSIKGNYPLTASYCAACLSFIGVSTHEGLLKQPEQEHRCRNRRTPEQVASTRTDQPAPDKENEKKAA